METHRPARHTKTETICIRQLIHSSLKIMAAKPPFGQGKPVKPDAKITVDFPADIVPAAKSEQLDALVKQTLSGYKSIYQGMIDYHGWTPARAQREMDMIAAEKRAHLVDIGFKGIVDVVMARQEDEATTNEKTAAEDKLFKGAAVLESDRTANKETEE